MIFLTTEEAMSLMGALETIVEEAKELPQNGGPEATIQEQAEAQIAVIQRELSRPGVDCNPL